MSAKKSEVKNGVSKVKDKYGTVRFYKNRMLHREDGPAVEYANGEVEFWLDNEKYNEGDYNLVCFGRYWNEPKEEENPTFDELCQRVRDLEEKVTFLTSIIMRSNRMKNV